MRAQELQVHDQEIHLGVPHALPHAERGAVHPVHPRLDRRETVDQPQAAVAVAVPVNLHTVFLTISCLTKLTSDLTPSGVACPTVSARQMRVAPQSIAAPYSALRASGLARVVSSVTYMTGSPCFTAYVTASTVDCTMRSRVQSSAYCRIGDEPMNVAASMLIPTSWATRTIGSTSAITVRAAQFGARGSLASRISVASARTCSTTRGPAPGKPISAATIPRSAIRWSSRFLTSSAGSRTEGDCRPSRSVSSFRSTRTR